FLPLIFVEGIAGQLFRDQALTVTFALVVSLAVALTLIPMLSSLKVRSPVAFPEESFQSRDPRTRLGRSVRGARRFALNGIPEVLAAAFLYLGALLGRLMGLLLRPLAGGVGRLFSAVQRVYVALLPWALGHRAVVVLAALAALGGAAWLTPKLGAELIPSLAQGRFEMQLKLPPGTPLEVTDRAVSRIQQEANGVEVIRDMYAVSGTGNRIDANPTEAGENIGDLLVVLDGVDAAVERQAIDALRSSVRKIPGANAEFSRPQLFSFETPLEIEILGYDLDRLKAVSSQVAARLGSSDRFADVKSSLEAGHPEIQIRFDQERAAALGLTVKQISDQVVRKLRGEVATRYSWRDRKIDVLVRAEESDRSSVEDVRNLIVNPASDRPIVLASVADIVATEGPGEINRVDQERAAIVTANLRYGTLKEAVAEAEQVLEQVQMPYGVKSQIAGQSEEMDASFESLLFALGLAVFLVYLVMASQFESLIHPFVILLSVPLALVGAVLALFATGTPISVIVFIGLIMLAGIVVNNAIVLVDLINQLREQGMDKRAAIIEGGRSRLRPIVMTTLTTTLGLVPLALGIGEGAEVRSPLAITVIGGLLVSTLLTLVVVPVVYDLLDRGVRRPVEIPEAQPEHSR
ncbi:MAG: efflux RND transporter permease subunit, partial [Xanthomonadales bacterium]|nr:efflux RND transporter permease subunit [Xanthomonadales bacterium]